MAPYSLPPGVTMTAAYPGAHYVKALKTAQVPRRYFFFDTEAHRLPGKGYEEQTWRLGCSGKVNWSEHKKQWNEVQVEHHETPESLWQGLTAFAKKRERTVVVAHNLAYDLRIADAFSVLGSLGWTVDRPYIARESLGFDAKKDGMTLCFVDSLSVIPYAMKVIAGWLEADYLNLPGEDEPDAIWRLRCDQDVRLLSQAYMAVIEWLRADGIGSWARTGAGIGWHTVLRHHYRSKVLVHARPEIRDLEGKAMYAGRAEAWRWGMLTKGPYTEFDYQTAYGRICAETSLPTQYVGPVHGLSLPKMRAATDHYHYLVEAQVMAPLPMLPAHDDAGVFWPTGSFRGWWWDCELLNAATEGAQIKVLNAHRYRSEPWLSEWATWAMSFIGDGKEGIEALQSAVAKHWTRAVVGRTAARLRLWDYRGSAFQPGASYMPLMDVDTGKTGSMLTLGDKRWESWESRWSENALPQVLSYVMAVTRVRLWKALRAAGLENVVYCDTDSLITSARGTQRLREAILDDHLPGLRVKGVHKSLEVFAPQLVEGQTYRRLAGVPRRGTRVGTSEYQCEVWESLTRGLASGHPDRVRVRTERFSLAGLDTRRVHLPGGLTEPFTVVDGIRQSPRSMTA